MNREWGLGNREQRESVKFIQSVSDFPLLVSLGEKSPSWGLNRWASGGLRFVPPDDEGFSLRRDKRRLVYKGRRRSHRFTILGNNAFEYDVILNREPETNTITLCMEGAEKFDFFRQPDFIKNPLLAGSYAVYKKETLLGEGTGKLCHIHRPEIIDAKGRRCWGDLSIAGNELCITIPEYFLSEAAYPVVVDPTIGTTTVGSQEKWYDTENNDVDDDENWRPLFFEITIPVNKFSVPETINGNCMAYIYVNNGVDPDNNRPVIYSDNGNKPLNRLSKDETDFDSRVSRNQPRGWRTAPFKTKNSIPAGSNIWFGVCSCYWEARFDYGQMIFVEEYDYQDPFVVPDVYPQQYINWYANHPQEVQQFYNYKVSWYFTYSSAQNYVRTLTQGVTLADNRKLTGNYKRTATQAVKGTTALGRFAVFPRKCLMNVKCTMTLNAWPTLIRKVIEQVRATMGLTENRGLTRQLAENVRANMEARRSQGFYRKAQEHIKGTDQYSFPVLFTRSLPETVKASENVKQWGAYIRGLWETAASMAETTHGGAYYRAQSETVQAAGTVFRGLLIFVKIFTTSFVRDFLIRRFLKSNEDLVLKSCICRELILDSPIH